MGRKNSNSRTGRTSRNLHAVADTGTPAEQALIEAVTTHPDTTAKELAAIAEVGHSTTRRILAEHAEKGTIKRSSAAGTGPGRAPDHWRLANATTAKPAPTPVATPGCTATDDTEPTGANEPIPGGGHEPAFGQFLSGEDVADEAGASEPEGSSSEPEPHSGAGVAGGGEQPAAADPQQVATTGPKPRAGKNELRGKVEDYLLQHPAEEFGPHALGTVLGHSSGAIANVLEKLVTGGYARRVRQSPKRYTAISTEAEDTAAG